jgi:alpha-L-fucosidase 2
LHPGQEIGVDTPELLSAARRSLEFRGDAGTGWSRAWKVNFWARLRDGDHAWRVLNGLLTLTGAKKTEMKGGGVYANLFDAHPPFQIDGNFGAANGIIEMLLQSQRERDGVRLIELLPALPAAWSEGAVAGLRARGGFEIDLAWTGGKLQRAMIRSLRGEKLVVQYGERIAALEIPRGEETVLNGELKRLP